MTVYVAGPMSGIEDFNRPAFHLYASALEQAGVDVLNPAAIDLGPGASWCDYLAIAVRQLAKADEVHFLPGWEKSEGACVEEIIARKLGLPIFEVPMTQKQILNMTSRQFGEAL